MAGIFALGFFVFSWHCRVLSSYISDDDQQYCVMEMMKYPNSLFMFYDKSLLNH